MPEFYELYCGPKEQPLTMGGRIEELNEGIKSLIATVKDFSATKSQTIEQLMKRYSLTHDQAAAAVQTNW